LNDELKWAGTPWDVRESFLDRMKELERQIELVEAIALRAVASMNEKEGSSISWSTKQQLTHGNVYPGHFPALQKRFRVNEKRIHCVESVLIEIILRLNETTRKNK